MKTHPEIDLGLGHIQCDLGGSLPLPGPAGKYGARGGDPALRNLIAAHHNVPSECVCVTAGASLGLAVSLASLSRPGSVLCPRPYYPAYPHLIRAFGFTPIFYDVDRVIRHGAQELERTCTQSVRALIWNSPGNPTGQISSLELDQELGELAASCRFLVIRDEVYEGIRYDDGPVPPAHRGLSSETVSIRSFSKLFGMPGERLGYVLGHSGHIEKFETLHWHMAMSAPATGQSLGMAFAQSDISAHCRDVSSRLRVLRDAACRALRDDDRFQFNVPDAGVFLWMRITVPGIDTGVVSDILAQKGLRVFPGAAFGSFSPDRMRVSFAVSRNDLVKGISILRTGLDAYCDALPK